MNDAQPSLALTPIGLRFDPLRQHPVNPVHPVVFSGPGLDAASTTTIFLSHPFERLSPTLASSPRIVEADCTRRASVYLDVGEINTMHSRLIPGADFFDDGSSESDSGANAALLARTYTETSGPDHRGRPHDMSNDERHVPRGRSRHRSAATALSNVMSLPVNSEDYSVVNEAHAAGLVVIEDGNTPSHARKMSLTRLNKDNVRLVDGRSTRSSIDSPRHSIFNGCHNSSLPGSPSYPSTALAAMFSTGAIPGERSCKNGEDTLAPLPQSPRLRNGGHHRRSASDSNSSSDSLLADSVINAHVHTMRALEALSAERSNEHVERSIAKEKETETVVAGRSYLNSGTTTSWPKSTTSLSENRRVRLGPLSTGTATPERGGRRDEGDSIAANMSLASPYMDATTTNPFATPLPETSPRLAEPRYDANYTGTPLPNFSLSASNPSTRSMDHYARLDSACTDVFPEEIPSYLPNKPENAYTARKGKHVLGLLGNGSEESLDLRSRRERNESAQGLIRSHAEPSHGKSRKDSAKQDTSGLVIWVGAKKWTWGMRKETERARGSNNGIGPPMLETIVIPNKLFPDSGTDDEKQGHCCRYPRQSGINNVNDDFDDAAFAERLRSANCHLIGHWFGFSARTLRGIQFGRRSMCCIARIHDSSHESRTSAAEKQGTSTLQPYHPSETYLLTLYKNPAIGSKKYMVVTWARRIAVSSSSSSSSLPRDALVPTLELVYMVSPTRVLLVMAVLLGISVAAALTWVFLGHGGGGKGTTGPSQRVGSGMAIGVLVLLVEGCGFGGWVAFS